MKKKSKKVLGTYQVTINTEADQSLYCRVMKALLKMRADEYERARNACLENIKDIEIAQAKIPDQVKGWHFESRRGRSAIGNKTVNKVHK